MTLSDAKAQMRMDLRAAGFTDEQITAISKPLARYVAEVVRSDRAQAKFREMLDSLTQTGARLDELFKTRTPK